MSNLAQGGFFFFFLSSTFTVITAFSFLLPPLFHLSLFIAKRHPYSLCVYVCVSPSVCHLFKLSVMEDMLNIVWPSWWQQIDNVVICNMTDISTYTAVQIAVKCSLNILSAFSCVSRRDACLLSSRHETKIFPKCYCSSCQDFFFAHILWWSCLQRSLQSGTVTKPNSSSSSTSIKTLTCFAVFLLYQKIVFYVHIKNSVQLIVICFLSSLNGFDSQLVLAEHSNP